MKLFSMVCASLFLFRTCVFADEQPISLEYSIRPLIENEKSILEVNLKFQGNENGMTEIVLPSSWAGQKELYFEISNLHCLSSQVSIENTDQPEIKKIHHPSNEPIQIIYHVTSREKKTEWYYRPLVEQSYFFFFGHCFFAIPKVHIQTKAKISIEWKDFSSDWTLANSFGALQCKQELSVPLVIFQHAVYTGGDFQVLQCGHEKAPIFVAIRGKWSFSNERLINLIQTVIESQRQFWNDFDFPYYLITVLPTGDDSHMGGTGLFNAFSIFIGDLPEDDEEGWKWLTWLLSHEHFHSWNGVKMMSQPSDGSLYWFTEGFTEYYSAKLNYKSQLIDINDYLNQVNTILYDYYTSPVHDAKNDRIQKDFWNDWDIQRLPYIRGFLFALKWDKKMQEASHGQYSLDDFMLALFKRTRENRQLFSQQDIALVASSFLPPEEAQKDIKEYILEGKTLFPEEEGVYAVKWMEDVGFNLQQTIAKGRIEGVKQGSSAFEAGLRNGQKFLGYQSIDQSISVSVVGSKGNTKALVYPKDPITRSIPQYELQENLIQ